MLRLVESDLFLKLIHLLILKPGEEAKLMKISLLIAIQNTKVNLIQQLIKLMMLLKK